MLEGRNQNVHVYLLSVQIANDSRHMDQSEWGLATFQDLSKKILKLAPIILTLLCTYKLGNKRMTAKQGGPVYYKMHSIEIIGPLLRKVLSKSEVLKIWRVPVPHGLFSLPADVPGIVIVQESQPRCPAGLLSALQPPCRCTENISPDLVPKQFMQAKIPKNGLQEL